MENGLRAGNHDPFSIYIYIYAEYISSINRVRIECVYIYRGYKRDPCSFTGTEVVVIPPPPVHRACTEHTRIYIYIGQIYRIYIYVYIYICVCVYIYI